ncbi:specifically androgen-regulated gene protein [Sceloporus undulatus]|uniref:specifically androgen-regulated gene protein n=1 Tax=Sceloporus undulatus TaxID=8520 RepID=UPI001C4B91F1|nr:specifically androgen-regulated gene protein [Sceloporus undulatus]XP_042321889.1 specifically androgen-regulated gene protein [Sceloporus undulatus]XP_042321890.1 specifically androgen-regulated gene protein [Sceloporus undulatus]XP_042321891.1 specifically androgen-regulated gene protein [Sceloporus undulatus]XP_042321892.1 specifically androgen-regulated gene protein [Sceloporus undulatus]XP_042321893.1 specifically androgen-regulated gene protein [Sceloporus undulatus]
MPKKDLWVETSDPDPAIIVGSAGSCDSMISNNSSASEMNDSGYDYLSVEEKECLMFLEETLDSLDTEADSGLSADETGTAESSKHPRTWPSRDVPKGLDLDNLQKHKKFEINGNKRVSGLVSIPTPGHHSLPRNVTVKSVPKTPNISLVEATGSNTDNPKDLPQICVTSWESPKHEIFNISNGQPRMTTQPKASDLESVVIPPPEPFQDHRQGYSKREQEPQFLNKDSQKDVESVLSPHFEVRSVDIAERYEGASIQPEPSPVKAGLERGKEVILKSLFPKANKKNYEQMMGVQENGQKPTLEETLLDSNFKQGPPTAPKPRKLPPNIILKTSRSNAVSLNIDPNHKIKVLSPANGRPRAATGDFSMEKVHSLQKEQERARREALEKLGLPLDNEKDPEDHVTKNSAYSKSRETFRNHSRENLHVDNITPNKKPDQEHGQVGGKGIYAAEKNTPGIKQANFKSNTLERSGVGLSSYISSSAEDQNIKNISSIGKMSFFDKITPNFLRNSRPRPASLGMGKDFVDLKENKMHNDDLEKNDKRRSYPFQHPSKLPRPPCVSVKITPKGAAEEHRREALKKLGLLKE